MLIRWRLPRGCPDAIEAEQAKVRSQPEITIGRLGNRVDLAFGKSIANLPRSVCILTYIQRRIEREHTRAARHGYEKQRSR